MKSARLDGMIKGWFVGQFSPTAYNTSACEVAVKQYCAGDKEEMHYHKVATEITLVLMGKVLIAGKEWGDGDIVVLEPGEATAFEAITDTTIVVVKVPGVLDDKFPFGASK
jgi:quercetin dioxygenase-like cupin family protein